MSILQEGKHRKNSEVISPLQWLRAFEREFVAKGVVDDARLARLLGLSLEAGSPAERWWEQDIDDETRSSFILAKAAFHRRFSTSSTSNIVGAEVSPKSSLNEEVSDGSQVSSQGNESAPRRYKLRPKPLPPGGGGGEVVGGRSQNDPGSSVGQASEHNHNRRNSEPVSCQLEKRVRDRDPFPSFDFQIDRDARQGEISSSRKRARTEEEDPCRHETPSSCPPSESSSTIHGLDSPRTPPPSQTVGDLQTNDTDGETVRVSRSEGKGIWDLTSVEPLPLGRRDPPPLTRWRSGKRIPPPCDVGDPPPSSSASSPLCRGESSPRREDPHSDTEQSLGSLPADLGNMAPPRQMGREDDYHHHLSIPCQTQWNPSQRVGEINRKFSAKIMGRLPGAPPKRRGRKPKKDRSNTLSSDRDPSAPKKRGRKPKNAVVAEKQGEWEASTPPPPKAKAAVIEHLRDKLRMKRGLEVTQRKNRTRSKLQATSRGSAGGRPFSQRSVEAESCRDWSVSTSVSTTAPASEHNHLEKPRARSRQTWTTSPAPCRGGKSLSPMKMTKLQVRNLRLRKKLGKRMARCPFRDFELPLPCSVKAAEEEGDSPERFPQQQQQQQKGTSRWIQLEPLEPLDLTKEEEMGLIVTPSTADSKYVPSESTLELIENLPSLIRAKLRSIIEEEVQIAISKSIAVPSISLPPPVSRIKNRRRRERNLPCGLCSKVFKLERRRENHVRLFHGVDPNITKVFSLPCEKQASASVRLLNQEARIVSALLVEQGRRGGQGGLPSSLQETSSPCSWSELCQEEEGGGGGSIIQAAALETVRDRDEDGGTTGLYDQEDEDVIYQRELDQLLVPIDPALLSAQRSATSFPRADDDDHDDGDEGSMRVPVEECFSIDLVVEEKGERDSLFSGSTLSDSDSGNLVLAVTEPDIPRGAQRCSRGGEDSMCGERKDEEEKEKDAVGKGEGVRRSPRERKPRVANLKLNEDEEEEDGDGNRILERRRKNRTDEEDDEYVLEEDEWFRERMLLGKKGRSKRNGLNGHPVERSKRVSPPSASSLPAPSLPKTPSSSSSSWSRISSRTEPAWALGTKDLGWKEGKVRKRSRVEGRSLWTNGGEEEKTSRTARSLSLHRCDLCWKEFFSKRWLDHHREKHHPNDMGRSSRPPSL